jgi:hypothetical protein
MAPADLLRPLEGQRAETLRVLDTLTETDLARIVRGGARTVGALLCHLVAREHEVTFAILNALDGRVVHLSPEERDRITEAQHAAPALDWDLARIRRELLSARAELRQAFASMGDDDLDLAIRWPEWAARTIRTSIPYLIEHEDSHIDELREALGRS